MQNILITGHRLPPKAKQVLQEIMQAAGLGCARITDVTRTFDQQAQAIVDYYKVNGAAAAKKLYGRGPGGIAIGIFETQIAHLPLPEILRQMSDSMRQAIQKERHSHGQRHLMHTSDTHFVFDVAPSSIADPEAFVRAAAKHPRVSRFLHPGSAPPDKAFHLEIPIAG